MGKGDNRLSHHAQRSAQESRENCASGGIMRISQTEELFENSPLPLGEGLGVRVWARCTNKNRCHSQSRPHPNPLPKGEGTGTQAMRLA